MIGVIAGNVRMIALPTLVTALIPEEGRDKANGLVGMTTGIGFLTTSAISGFGELPTSALMFSAVAGRGSHLVRDEDVQVLHGFDSVAHANDYLASDLFTGDVVRELGPLLQADPEVRVFDVA